MGDDLRQITPCGYGSLRSQGRHLFCLRDCRVSDVDEATVRVVAARFAPERLLQSDPHHGEGGRNGGCWPEPWPALKKKSRRQSPQVQPKQPGIPRAIGFNGLYALSPGT